MKILEVRDGFVKFESSEDLFISSLVKIEGQSKSYVAQILQIKSNVAIAKILYLYNGKLEEYDKTAPSTDSEVTILSIDVINEINENRAPLIIGKYRDENIIVDADSLNKKAIMCVDNKSEKNLIIQNIARQFNNLEKNVLIIDTTGNIEAKKYVAGVDFKLPLDSVSLKFIYEECLNDATSESKSLIIEIFKDLLEYASTVEYLPFQVLKSIVDDLVDKSHVFKLLVLKNKLARFSKLGYFANDKNDVQRVNKILSHKCSVVDFSKLDSTFLNRYLAYIYQNVEEDTQVMIELSSKMSKKSIKNIFDSDVCSLFISSSEFKYLSNIKEICENYIVIPSKNINAVFGEFSAFLKQMRNEEFLIAGKYTNYLPLISKLQLITDNVVVKEEPIITEKIEEEPENLSDEEEQNDTEICITEDEPNDEQSILENITEKSQTTILGIAETLEEPENIVMFEENDGQAENIDDNELNKFTDSQIENLDEISEEIQDKTESVEVDNESTEMDSQTKEDYDYETIAHETIVLDENTEDINSNNIDENIDIAEQNSDDEIIIETDDLDALEESLDQYQEQVVTEEIENVSDESEINIEDSLDDSLIPDENVITLDEEDNIDGEEFLELESSQANENDILVDMNDESVNLDEELDEQIKKDVDQVYTTIKDDEVSESDLDFIDEIKNDTVLEQLSEDNSLEELMEYDNQPLEEYHSGDSSISEEEPEILETKNSSTPIVPVYEAEIPPEDMVNSDPIEQGDSVMHAKYGHGVVEKLVKYGSKTLYMINFESGGRKLLDPLLTEIKKN